MTIIRPSDPRVVPGWWAYHCCHEDLEQLTDESLADLRDPDNDDWGQIFDCFPTKNEALTDIAEMWERSGYPDNAAKAREMMDP